MYRNGEGMRPDVAAAFDRMAAAARRGGLTLVVNSGFRSDAEQAGLFAANPDPTWVAPPGQSLHRCATELDLGPPNPPTAGSPPTRRRFGFVQRYSWEPWHYGFDAGPPPCSAAGDESVRAESTTGGGPTGPLAGRGCRPSSPPASGRRCCARPRAGTSPPRCSPRS